MQLEVLLGFGGLGGVLVPPGSEPFLLSIELVPLTEPPSTTNGAGDEGALPGPGEFSSPS